MPLIRHGAPLASPAYTTTNMMQAGNRKAHCSQSGIRQIWTTVSVLLAGEQAQTQGEKRMEPEATTVILEETDIQELASHLRGTLLHPGDEGYDQARQVHNGMIDRHPALIVRSRDVADVIAAVNFARDHRLILAVRGGGHSGPGLGT